MSGKMVSCLLVFALLRFAEVVVVVVCVKKYAQSADSLEEPWTTISVSRFCVKQDCFDVSPQ